MSRHSIRSTEGVITVDHRASPGLPEGFFRQIGIPDAGPAQGIGEGAVFEAPTMTCRHCRTIVVMNPNRQRERGYCRKCDGYICDKPECRMECNPIDQRFENQLKSENQLLLPRSGR